ncbi:MAG TPA: hypothetical protein PKA63_03790 [Oligoflexia bacterium]|nr:hypothetical protein [Oligoflexia bacterium]HMP47774.1 hypothetical protein [Oligoflexia bacterium]
MKILVVTRSICQELYELSGSLLRPLNLTRIPLRDTDALGYFIELSTLDADWIINIDEDAFVTCPEHITSLLKFMNNEGYDVAGMPDGGVFHHRFHNPLVPNAFFTIHRMEFLKKNIEAGLFNPQSIKGHIHQAEYETKTPHHLIRGKYSFDNFEPYYDYFFWLHRYNARFLYLDAIHWNRDPTSTVLLSHEKKPFLIHCWYARAYAEQQKRFLDAWQFAKDIQEQRKDKSSYNMQ